jgi:hypothetical protein
MSDNDDKIPHIQSLSEFIGGFVPPEPKWGNWEWDGGSLSCKPYGKPVGEYVINEEQFDTPAKALNMIEHVSRKDWANDERLAGLVRSIRDNRDRD